LSESATIAPDAKPRLPHWVLLAPERLFKADAIAVEILKRCTGEVTFDAIVDDLANTFTAPRERISADASTLLRGLAEKKLLEL
jgi:pyrroloquinoline quinone biosynthesis protein D